MKKLTSKPSQKDVCAQAQALRRSCILVMRSRHATTVPDPRITAHAVRILEAAKALQPSNELLQSLEIEHGSWPTILAVMEAVLQ